MNQIIGQIATILVTLSILGCHATNHRADPGDRESKQAVLQDSLRMLDSLVLKYRVKNADESIRYARLAGVVAHRAQTSEAAVKGWIILGNAWAIKRIDSAFYYYHKAWDVADSLNLTGEKGKILYSLGMLYHSAGNYKEYIMLVDSARRYAGRVSDFVTLANTRISLGNFYFNIGESVKARAMFDSALAVSERQSLALQKGTALGNLARFETDNNKAIAAQRRAISLMQNRSGSEEPVASILINIGNRLSNADSAMNCFNTAISMVSAEFAPEVIIGAYNNMAYCYLWKGDAVNAEKCITDYALPLALKTKNDDWQSTVYDTYADILAKEGKAAEAAGCRQKSLAAKKSFGDSAAAGLAGMKN